jgi:hypothetical protein
MFLAKHRKQEATQQMIDKKMSQFMFSPNANKPKPIFSPDEKRSVIKNLNERLLQGIKSHTHAGISTHEREYIQSVGELSFQPNLRNKSSAKKLPSAKKSPS